MRRAFSRTLSTIAFLICFVGTANHCALECFSERFVSGHVSSASHCGDSDSTSDESSPAHGAPCKELLGALIPNVSSSSDTLDFALIPLDDLSVFLAILIEPASLDAPSDSRFSLASETRDRKERLASLSAASLAPPLA